MNWLQALRRAIAPAIAAWAIGAWAIGTGPGGSAIGGAAIGTGPGGSEGAAWAAQAKTKHVASQAAASSQVVHVFAWKVVPPGSAAGSHPDYLVGTAHFGLTPGAKLAPAFVSALGGCGKFFMEADLDSVTPELVARYITLPPGKTLDAMVPASAWRKIQAAAKPLGLGPQQLKAFDPWYVSMLLTLPETEKDKMLDSVLRQSAEGRKMQIGFLETAADVFSAMQHVDPKEEVAMLLETLDDIAREKREVAEIATDYRRGDIAAIEKLLFDADRLKRYPDYFDQLLFKRNTAWLPEIEQALQGHDAMIAVGLGHLVGPRGLVAALRAKGYQVEPVRL